MSAQPAQQHDLEIHRNLERWHQKRVLRREYERFYRLIVEQVDAEIGGRVVELGSGIGNLKQYLPGALCTDLFANPWIDQVENAYRLSFPGESVSHLILFDVFHHLQFPGNALDEFLRVLQPGGRVIIFEPDLSVLGWLVYGLLHAEPVAAFKQIEWHAPASVDLVKAGYYAAQGNAHRVFLSRPEQVLQRWEIVSVRRRSALAYVASGGYGKKQALPECAFPVLRRLEKLTDCLPAVFSTRLLVVLRKPKEPGSSRRAI